MLPSGMTLASASAWLPSSQTASRSTSTSGWPTETFPRRWPLCSRTSAACLGLVHAVGFCWSSSPASRCRRRLLGCCRDQALDPRREGGARTMSFCVMAGYKRERPSLHSLPGARMTMVRYLPRACEAARRARKATLAGARPAWRRDGRARGGRARERGCGAAAECGCRLGVRGGWSGAFTAELELERGDTMESDGGEGQRCARSPGARRRSRGGRRSSGGNEFDAGGRRTKTKKVVEKMGKFHPKLFLAKLSQHH